jgi:hypothetical protein
VPTDSLDEEEASMAIARVVSFEGVDPARIQELQSRITEGDRPEGVDATELMLLHDAQGGKALAILFFDTEEAYKRGDEVLNAMPADETPGSRASVAKYDVAVRFSD